MLSNIGSAESVVKYAVYRLLTIAAILFYWTTMQAVQQLTGLTQAGPMDWPIRPVSCCTQPKILSKYTTHLINVIVSINRNSPQALQKCKCIMKTRKWQPGRQRRYC